MEENESETPSETTTATPGDSSASHLDAIQLEPEPGTAEDAPAGDGAATWDGFVTAEAFAQGFAVTFAMIGQLTGLDTLKSVPQNPATAPAAKALYDTCRDTSWLHWLVRPESKWMQRTVALGAFAVPLAMGCQHELRARRAKPINDPAQEPDSDISASSETPPAKEPPPADMAPLT